jgi:hypothetical protein
MSLQSIGQNLLNSGFLNDLRSNFSGTKNEISDAKLLTSETQKSKPGDISTREKNSFFDQILNPKNTKPAINPETMSMRLSELKAKGNLVRHHPLPGVVKDYVKDLKNFLGDIKDQAYQAEHRDELFQRIKIVDENLDKLADEALNDQKRELAMVASLGELQGLLIDVFA